MKDAESRDVMTARVKATFAKYPNFMALPENSLGNLRCGVKNSDEASYVKALYDVCSRGEVIGRDLDNVIGCTV